MEAGSKWETGPASCLLPPVSSLFRDRAIPRFVIRCRSARWLGGGPGGLSPSCVLISATHSRRASPLPHPQSLDCHPDSQPVESSCEPHALGDAVGCASASSASAAGSAAWQQSRRAHPCHASRRKRAGARHRCGVHRVSLADRRSQPPELRGLHRRHHGAPGAGPPGRLGEGRRGASRQQRGALPLTGAELLRRDLHRRGGYHDPVHESFGPEGPRRPRAGTRRDEADQSRAPGRPGPGEPFLPCPA